MENLLQDTDDELTSIANRLIIMKIENPDLDLTGCIRVIKSKINRKCIEIGEIGGENGSIWKD